MRVVGRSDKLAQALEGRIRYVAFAAPIGRAQGRSSSRRVESEQEQAAPAGSCHVQVRAVRAKGKGVPAAIVFHCKPAGVRQCTGCGVNRVPSEPGKLAQRIQCAPIWVDGNGRTLVIVDVHRRTVCQLPGHWVTDIVKQAMVAAGLFVGHHIDALAVGASGDVGPPSSLWTSIWMNSPVAASRA